MSAVTVLQQQGRGPSGSYATLSLDALSPAAASYVRGRNGPLGVAVVVPTHGAIYAADGDAFFFMASVAKVVIMATLLDRTLREHRELTQNEVGLLERMITVSDNAAASALWSELGGGDSIAAFLQSIGLIGIQPGPGGFWGDSRASAKAVALLLAKLANREILDDTRCDYALNLMSRVISAQRWGVTAALTDHPLAGTRVSVKNGWRFEDPPGSRWIVNSTGVIQSGDGISTYAIVVLSSGQPVSPGDPQAISAYGIETCVIVGDNVWTVLSGLG